MGSPPPPPPAAADTAFMHMKADVKRDLQDTPDTEMTSLLTFPEQNSEVDSSIDKMADPFRSARDRSTRMTGEQGQGNAGSSSSSTGNNASLYTAPTWRRNDEFTQGKSGSQTPQIAPDQHVFAGGNYAGLVQPSNTMYSHDHTPTRVGSSIPGHALTAFSNSPGTPTHPKLINYHPETGGPINSGVPINETYPGPVYPTPAQRQFAYGYCLDRGNGNFTPLIPADELPLNTGYRRYGGPEGKMILPVPQAQHPSVYATQGMDVPLVPRDVIIGFPLYDPNGPKTREPSVQATIDTIVGSNITGRIDHSTTPRRDKIYCDKWVHEGTCAFTQVGCKYRHEMPHDRATQKSLGLNGYPVWYRRATELSVRDDRPPAVSVGDGVNRTKKGGATGRAGGQAGRESWRARGSGPARQAAAAAPALYEPPSPTGSDNGAETVVFGGRHRNSGHVPIALPPRRLRGVNKNSNPYHALEKYENNEM